MTDYKGPFTWDWTMDEDRIVLDRDGDHVPVKVIVAMLNAHARRSAQRCETCRHGKGYCDIRDAAMANGYKWATFGCTAHQPKEGK